MLEEPEAKSLERIREVYSEEVAGELRAKEHTGGSQAVYSGKNIQADRVTCKGPRGLSTAAQHRNYILTLHLLNLSSER